MQSHAPANRLALEPSPYLQQHAHNPVDWYPWGEEAFATARRDHKPVLLSVGYSACHWCHVMAHECFEDPAIAALMNERFVNIKVDREERPDVDHLYQTVCQLLTRSGGWPLTVFLTPAAEPYYAGTYFPPRPMYGRAGFPEILTALADAFHEQPDKVAEQAATLLDALARSQAVSGGGPLHADLLEAAWRGLEPNFDREQGGFGGAPKFPNPFNLDLFLRQHARSGDTLPLELVLQGCRAMRAGGVYDQLGGGFHRYSVDAAWTIPHFEKMLYDNALLPPVYLAAWQASGAPELAATVRETLDYLLREMQSPVGGFYSTTDADSEGEEGRYFVWTPAQVRELLPPEDAALVSERFGITSVGNFEHGSTCLNVAAALPALATSRGWSEEATASRLSATCAVLLAARSERVPPFRDEKVLASWNGLAVSALARAALLLGDDRYLAAARHAASFVLEAMRPDPAHLCRSCKDGAARGEGFLDDYGNVALGLLDLFAADGDPRWCTAATALAETVLNEFVDDAHGDFHMTRSAGERLIVRPKDQHDNAVPSGLSAAGHALWRLARLTEDERYHNAVERLLVAHGGGLRENPWGMANLLALLDDFLAEPESVVVVGRGAAADALLRAATAGYHPHRLVCRVPDPETPGLPSLLAHKGRPDGQPCAYVCRGRVCSAPLLSADILLEHLVAS